MGSEVGSQIVREGEVELRVPEVKSTRGPGKRGDAVFYNPAMEFNRDVNVSIARVLFKRGRTSALDGLAASGARGVRLAREVRAGDGSPLLDVTINDHDPEAFHIIQENIHRNCVENATASNMKLGELLARERFRYIDVDPFGSPVPFLDAAVQALENRGVLSVTATDTAPLCGTYPTTCVRRYGARPRKGAEMHEIGLRILVGYVAREGAKYDMAVHPLLSYYADHYFRLYVEMKGGARVADKALANIGFLDDRVTGPLWLGELHDERVLREMATDERFGTARRLEKYIGLWRGEVEMPALFHHSDEVASSIGAETPRIMDIIDALQGAGFRACKTHFHPNGIKTDASREELSDIIRGLGR